jgi:hypothetical protein
MKKYILQSFLLLVITCASAQNNKILYHSVTPPKTIVYADSSNRFGHEIIVSSDISKFAYSQSKTTSTWTFHIAATKAKSVSLIFSEVDLSESGNLSFSDNKNKVVHKGFNQLIAKGVKTFGTPLIASDTVVVTYSQPINQKQPNLTIQTIVYGFKEPFQVLSEDKLGFGSGAACLVDAACKKAEWCNQINAVGLIVVGGSANCSGSLISNSNLDNKSYFITAEHCVFGNNPATWVVYFNYQSSVCSPSVDGRLIYYVLGASIKANDPKADYALLEFFNPVPYSYNPYFAGWNSAASKPKSGVNIHHPLGDVKKINTYSEKPKKTNWDHDDDNSTVKRRVWELEFTEGGIQSGSSGSPLFNQNGQIVGVASGVSDGLNPVCSREENLYGRFRKMMSNGARAYLDPNPSAHFIAISGSTYPICPNARTISGILTNGFHTSSQQITSSGTTIALAGSEINIEAGNKISLKHGFHAKSNSNTLIRIKACSNVCMNLKNSVKEQTIYLKDTVNKDNYIVSAQNDFTVFPNPTTGRVTFMFEGSFKPIYIEVRNQLGSLLKRIALNKEDRSSNLDLSQFDSGIYFVTVLSKDDVITKIIEVVH